MDVAYNKLVRSRFSEAKATQAAAMLLKRRGGKMSHLKLIKLLYLVDRQALLAYGVPVTTDRWVSMPKGPVVSQILDLIHDGDAPGEGGYWSAHISAPIDHEVSLLQDPGDDELSASEVRLINSVFDHFGAMGRWDLVRYTHDLPEWTDPNGSSLPITERDILKAGGKSDEEISEIEAELDNLRAAQALFVPA